jgi:hypothetical protein
MNSPRPARGFTHSDLSEGPVKTTLAAVIIILILPAILLIVSVSVLLAVAIAILVRVRVRCFGGNWVHVFGPFLNSFGGCGVGGLVIDTVAVGLLREESLVFGRETADHVD